MLWTEEGQWNLPKQYNMVKEAKRKKAYLIPCIRAVRMEEDGAAALVLIHQTGVLEMANQSWFPLDSGISKWCYLLTIKFFPLFTIESLQMKTKGSDMLLTFQWIWYDVQWNEPTIIGQDNHYCLQATSTWQHDTIYPRKKKHDIIYHHGLTW